MLQWTEIQDWCSLDTYWSLTLKCPQKDWVEDLIILKVWFLQVIEIWVRRLAEWGRWLDLISLRWEPSHRALAFFFLLSVYHEVSWFDLATLTSLQSSASPTGVRKSTAKSPWSEISETMNLYILIFPTLTWYYCVLLSIVIKEQTSNTDT